MTEDQRREYKSSWRNEWMKNICGFANAQDGLWSPAERRTIPPLNSDMRQRACGWIFLPSLPYRPERTIQKTIQKTGEKTQGFSI